MGSALWILPISVGYFAHNKDGSWFNRDKSSVLPESALVLPEGANINKKKKDVKVSFIIKGLHGNYC